VGAWRETVPRDRLQGKEGAVISLAFAALIALLLSRYLPARNSDLDFAGAERDGVRYARSTLALTAAATRQRSAATAPISSALDAQARHAAEDKAMPVPTRPMHNRVRRTPRRTRTQAEEGRSRS
jgi:hypothetical protein